MTTLTQRVAPLHKGVWTAQAAYTKLDIVSFGAPAGSYLCVSDNTNQPPSVGANNSYWFLVCAPEPYSGVLSKTLTNASVTLTDAEANNPVILLSGALIANVSLIIPASAKRIFSVNNSCTGAFSVTVKTPSGSGIVLPNGKTSLVLSDGTNIVFAENNADKISNDLDLRYSRRFSSGQALPSVDIGAIWHDDYASIMTWQALSNNGIAYTGYASVNVGQVAYFDRVSAIPGFIKLNGAALSSSYAALKAATGRSTLVDARGEFFRSLDDGREVDAGRVIGSWQSDEFKSHVHNLSNGTTVINISVDAGNTRAGKTFNYYDYGTSPILPSGGTETRPRNIALTAYIKF